MAEQNPKKDNTPGTDPTSAIPPGGLPSATPPPRDSTAEEPDTDNKPPRKTEAEPAPKPKPSQPEEKSQATRQDLSAKLSQEGILSGRSIMSLQEMLEMIKEDIVVFNPVIWLYMAGSLPVEAVKATASVADNLAWKSTIAGLNGITCGHFTKLNQHDPINNPNGLGGVSFRDVVKGVYQGLKGAPKKDAPLPSPESQGLDRSLEDAEKLAEKADQLRDEITDKTQRIQDLLDSGKDGKGNDLTTEQRQQLEDSLKAHEDAGQDASHISNAAAANVKERQQNRDGPAPDGELDAAPTTNNRPGNAGPGS